MGTLHLVKTGLMGVLGTFEAHDFQIFPRDQRVVCRTRRGLEWGVIVCDLDSDSMTDSVDGDLLRPTTPDDEMILERLERFRDRAFEACRQLLAERQLSATLVDVEHLFDGESVFFYFLGDIDHGVEAITAELAQAYDRKVKFKKFAEMLSQGCGPECGTKDNGCSSSGCGSCAISGGCGSKKVTAAS